MKEFPKEPTNDKSDSYKYQTTYFSDEECTFISNKEKPYSLFPNCIKYW